jgi:peptide/nickel transport system substrate-binding protein
MTSSLLRVWTVIALIAALPVLAACGSDDDEGGGGGGGGGDRRSAIEQLTRGTATENEPGQGRRGGRLTVLAAGDVDYIDPGATYYSYAIGIMSALHRNLYSYQPNDTDPTPDLAEGEPEVSEDGRTVTVRLRRGVMFSEPVNREVTSDDVKYAIERAFSRNVQNGYATTYFGDLRGAPEEPGPLREISGIETPDDQTLVFRLTRGTGRVLAGALSLPITSPVPRDYARRFDRESPSTYGQHQVFTGPYRIEGDPEEGLSGYRANRFIRLERNPQYRNVGDYRPAYLDEIDFQAGNEDTNVSMRRILDGQSLASGDGGAPPTVLREALRNRPTQISLKPSGGFRYVSFDTSEPPFDDINVRRAVIAGFDRNALRLARGGEAIGIIATHFIPPGIAGHDESGGERGFGFDFLRNPRGDRNVMAQYFRRAGMQSGRYEGDDGEILLVADSAEPDKSIAESTERQLRDMGFRPRLRLVSRDTMFTRFCNRPASEVNVCPSVGWLKDFPDPQTMLDATFNGEAINDTNNSNWPELNVPAINQAMERGALITDPAEKARAWARINRQVTEQAPGIPYVWDYENMVSSRNVRGVQNTYSTTWDYNFTSLR